MIRQFIHALFFLLFFFFSFHTPGTTPIHVYWRFFPWFYDITRHFTRKNRSNPDNAPLPFSGRKWDTILLSPKIGKKGKLKFFSCLNFWNFIYTLQILFLLIILKLLMDWVLWWKLKKKNAMKLIDGDLF